MKIKGTILDRYPTDIIICMLWCLILTPFILMNISNTVRIIVGLPFILFIPGYLLLKVLFPYIVKDNSSIDSTERFALSIVLSISIIAILGIIFTFRSWTLNPEPLFVFLIVINYFLGIIALVQSRKQVSDKYYTLSFKSLFSTSSQNRLDMGLKSIIIILMFITVCIFSYAILAPRQLETYTEFYMLGENDAVADYPRNAALNEDIPLTIGIINHEYQSMKYTLEFWLVDQSTSISSSINHMWFLRKETVSLEHYSKDNTYNWESQWENTYNFSFDNRGVYKLMILLQLDDTKDYNTVTDYRPIYESKLEDAYREIHIWLQIT